MTYKDVIRVSPKFKMNLKNGRYFHDDKVVKVICEAGPDVAP